MLTIPTLHSTTLIWIEVYCLCYFTAAVSKVILTESATPSIPWYCKLDTLRLWYPIALRNAVYLHKNDTNCFKHNNELYYDNLIYQPVTVTNMPLLSFSYVWLHIHTYRYQRYLWYISFIELHTILLLCYVWNLFVIYKIPSPEPLLCIDLYCRYFDIIRFSSDQYPYLNVQSNVVHHDYDDPPRNGPTINNSIKIEIKV